MLINSTEEEAVLGQPSARIKLKTKLHFPSWRAILSDILDQARLKNPEHFDARSIDCRGIVDELEGLRQVLLSRNLNLLFAHSPQYRSTYTNTSQIDEVLAHFKYFTHVIITTCCVGRVLHRPWLPLAFFVGTHWKINSEFGSECERKKAH